MRPNSPIRRILRIAALALLLAGQTLGHAHAAEHGPLPGKAQCAVCSIAQQAGQAAVDCAPDLESSAPADPLPATAQPPLPGARPPVHRARSPPAAR